MKIEDLGFITSVKKFEENFGFYYDPAQKPSKNSDSFIGKILRENGMEK